VCPGKVPGTSSQKRFFRKKEMDTSQPYVGTMVKNHGIYINDTLEKGRGVFAARDFHFEDIIEVCPVIIIPEDDIPMINRTSLYHYYYDWENKTHEAALALGYGSLYNHSYKPNAMYVKDIDNNVIFIQCCRDIREGEEITINYNCDPQNQDPVWFRVLE